jgi:hypothetical protein
MSCDADADTDDMRRCRYLAKQEKLIPLPKDAEAAAAASQTPRFGRAAKARSQRGCSQRGRRHTVAPRQHAPQPLEVEEGEGEDAAGWEEEEEEEEGRFREGWLGRRSSGSVTLRCCCAARALRASARTVSQRSTAQRACGWRSWDRS